jgi:hypothetical protein
VKMLEPVEASGLASIGADAAAGSPRAREGASRIGRRL